MTVVTEELDLPSGANPTGITVKIRLKPSLGYTGDPATIIGTLDVTPDVDGSWQADLVPNSEIIPAGTVYMVQLEGSGDVSKRRRYISVPDAGPVALQDILTDEPAAVQSSALALHAAKRGLGGHLPDVADDGDTVTWNEDDEVWEAGPPAAGGGTVDVVSNVATSRILGRTTAGTGDSEELTAAQVRTLLNVEDGATGDQTAAELLTAIKTVDGAGSGLDADLLDGQSSAAFEAAGTAATAISNHEAAADPHTGYLKEADASSTYAPLPSGTPGAGKIPVGTGTGNGWVWTAVDDTVTAADIPFTPVGTIAATDVQAAIAEVASEGGSGGVGVLDGGDADDTPIAEVDGGAAA